MEINCASCKYGHFIDNEPRLFCWGQREAPEVAPSGCCTSWKSKVATQSDLVRAMSDEGLAELIAEGCCRDLHCPTQFRTKNGLDCYSCWLDWLRSPVTKEEEPNV